MDVNIVVRLLITFSPITAGIMALILLENRRCKKIFKQPKGNFQEIFGL